MPGPSHRARWVLIGAGALLLGLGVFGVLGRMRARSALRVDTDSAAIQVVSTVLPTPAPASQSLLVPGTVAPWQNVAIYARTTGYLRRWFVDIGDRVKEGQRLAELETPDVDQQLAQALAQLKSDEATARFARVTSERYQNLVAEKLVARQLADQFAANAMATASIAEADRANVRRLRDLQRFKFIEAPFDGLVTQRNTQVGALIDSGASGGVLFQIADTSKLRVFVDVPETLADRVAVGMAARIALTTSGGRAITGTIARTADALDPVTRTLRTEIDVDNPDEGVMPGLYAQVTLSLAGATNTLILPANTLLFRPEGLLVALVDAQSRVHLQAITTGRDFGQTVEVVSGLDAGAQVVINPVDSLREGLQVRVAPAAGPLDGGNNLAEAAEGARDEAG